MERLESQVYQNERAVFTGKDGPFILTQLL